MVELDDCCVAVEKGMREKLEKNEFLQLLPGDLGWQCKSGNIPGKDGHCIGLVHPFYPQSIRNYFFLKKRKQNFYAQCIKSRLQCTLRSPKIKHKTSQNQKKKKSKHLPPPKPSHTIVCCNFPGSPRSLLNLVSLKPHNRTACSLRMFLNRTE